MPHRPRSWSSAPASPGLSTARALVELGVSDVLVLDRATVGSGGTGKSSGIVRCHYGIRSLAAMAWRALPVLENAVEILGAESGYHNTGYLVGVGPQNLGALRANVAMHQRSGSTSSWSATTTARELWPAADLDDFAEFAYEPAAATATGIRRRRPSPWPLAGAGPACARTAAVAALDVHGERVHGRSPGRRRAASAPAMWFWPPGRGRSRLAAGVGHRPAHPGPAGPDPPGRPGPTDRAPPGLLRPGVAAVRAERRDRVHPGRRQRPLHPEWADPDDYRERADDEELIQMIPKFEHRFPGLERRPPRRPRTPGCYDVTPDYNPIISPSPIEGLWLCAGFSGHGYKISPSVGELMADLITTGTSRHPDIDHRDFRWERFAEDDLLVSPHPYAGAGQMR